MSNESSPITLSKPAFLSACEMIQLVLPKDTNTRGTLFGGRMMEWVDILGTIAAARHAGTHVVTASIDSMQFYSPIYVGEAVILKAGINEAFRTSMEVGVRVEVEDPREPQKGRRHSAKAYLTFVAVDAEGRPCAIPRVLPDNPENLRRQQEARIRKEIRKKMSA